MITIIDYRVGNLNSIKNMLKKLGIESQITDHPDTIAEADKLILPGVGSFDYGMEKLRGAPFFDQLNQKVLTERTPILGICLGVQLFTESSEEGEQPGLAWIKGHTIRFRQDRMPPKLKVPHMGWNEVSTSKPSRLFTNMYEEPRFYFVHTYHLELTDDSDELVRAKYGYPFTAGVEFENIVGVQFHPEKSHKFGMRLLENFAQYY